MSNLSSLSYYIPELIIISAILLIIILDIIPSTKPYTFNLALASIIASAFFLCQNYGESHSLFMGMIALDPFSHYFKYIFLFATFSIILISRFDRQLDKKYASEYNCLLLIVLLGLFLMSSSVNLLMIYLSIELVSIPSYILAGMLKNDKESNEASLKYVIFGSLASGLMLFGLSILYGITGSTDISGISSALQIIEFPLTIYFPLILILAGFGYKISMVPFHFWTPDVYEGAPTPITAFLSVAPKAAGFALLIRFFNTLFGTGQPLNSPAWQAMEGVPWQNILMVLAAVTMTVGNLVAIQQKNIKRLLAYSSIAHAGYILMGVPVLSQEGVYAIVFYIIVYLFMQLGAFFLAIVVSNRYGTETIEEYSGIGWKSPYLGFFMAVFMFSLTGIPPTAGFIGKMYLFAALINGGSQFYWLAIIGVLNSVISLYYYMRVVKVMYFQGEREKDLYVPDGMSAVIVLAMAIPSIYFGIRWSFLADWVNSSLKFFIAGF